MPFVYHFSSLLFFSLLKDFSTCIPFISLLPLGKLATPGMKFDDVTTLSPDSVYRIPGLGGVKASWNEMGRASESC